MFSSEEVQVYERGRKQCPKLSLVFAKSQVKHNYGTVGYRLVSPVLGEAGVEGSFNFELSLSKQNSKISFKIKKDGNVAQCEGPQLNS